MLAYPDTKIVGLAVEWGGDICRPCAVKRYGEATVERIYNGLSAGVEAKPLIRYQADETAIELGYECDLPEHGATGEERKAPCGFCDECLCEDCGERLDDPGPEVWE